MNFKVFVSFWFRLRKVKMDQRKLMDNASTVTDMAKVSSLKFKLQSKVSTYISRGFCKMRGPQRLCTFHKNRR